MHLSEKRGNFLLYVFFDNNESPKQTFIDQLNTLIMYGNLTDKPVLFVSKLPSEMQSVHFVAGCLKGNDLILIDPTGEPKQHDMFTIIGQLQKKSTIGKVLISKTVLQNDPEGYVSCGPICTEILRSWCHDPDLMSKLIQCEASEPILKKNCTYQTIDIKELLPSCLSELINTQPIVYSGKMLKIRESHLEHLQSRPVVLLETSHHTSLADVIDDCMNAQSQVVVKRAILDKTPLLQIHTEYEQVKKEQLAMQKEQKRKAPEKSKGKNEMGSLKATLSESRGGLIDPILHEGTVEVDVPSDNSCLFWAAALSYLLPVKDDDVAFQGNFLRLFGIDEIKHLDEIKLHIKNYAPTSNISMFESETFNRLVREAFRKRVAECMSDNRETFEQFYAVNEKYEGNFNDYMAKVFDDTFWGGDLEIRAISMLLKCNIQVLGGNRPVNYPDIHNQNVQDLTLVHANAKGKDDGVKNHYRVRVSDAFVQEPELVCGSVEDFYYNEITTEMIRFHSDDSCEFTSSYKSLEGSVKKPFSELHYDKNETQQLYGWKFHIVLSQTIEGNVAKGWDCIVDILIRNKVGETKVIRPEAIAPNDKTITIYACIEKKQRPMLEWQKIMNQIVHALVKNEVVPGHLPNEYRINGCLFVTYRNDLGINGGYSKVNNERMEPNPFERMIVSVPGQEALIRVRDKLVKSSSSHESILDALGGPRTEADKKVDQESSEKESVDAEKINRQFKENAAIMAKVKGNDSDDDNTPGCCSIG